MALLFVYLFLFYGFTAFGLIQFAKLVLNLRVKVKILVSDKIVPKVLKRYGNFKTERSHEVSEHNRF